MIRCVDTFQRFPRCFQGGVFELAPWRVYAQAHFGSGASLFEDDMNDCLKTGNYTYERDFLPVLQAVWNHPRLEEMHQSFLAAAKGLSERLVQRFGGGLDADLVPMWVCATERAGPLRSTAGMRCCWAWKKSWSWAGSPWGTCRG